MEKNNGYYKGEGIYGNNIPFGYYNERIIVAVVLLTYWKTKDKQIIL